MTSAHEFWVAPKRYIVKPGRPVVAALAVGQMMRGSSLPYITQNIRRFTITTPNGTRKAEGIDGDIPALTYTARVPGLHVITHETTPRKARFDDWDKFLFYLSYEGLDAIAEEHLARGLPRAGFDELYIRCAKALVQVGRVREGDRDSPRGMPLELLAEGNPYRPGINTLSVRLLRGGGPVAGRQVAVFRYDGRVSRTLIRTDDGGRIRIAVTDGGSFLLNAVDLEAIDGDTAVWRSYWATLTFSLPLAK